METDTLKTVVVFRKYPDGQIIALFPYDYSGSFSCMSYMHIGQHGAAHYPGVIDATKPAIESEYSELKSELETNFGYNFEVRKKVMYRKMYSEWVKYQIKKANELRDK